MVSLKFLEEWYQSNCDGDWEHSYGITIETLDNPGWVIKVDLTDSNLENIEIKKEEDNNENDWISINVKNKQLFLAGSPQKLEILIKELEKIIKGEFN